MGAPSRITLEGDVEYWHYGDSWIAMTSHRVAKYSNQGALKMERLGSDGAPVGPDIPDVKPPENDDITKNSESVNQNDGIIRIRPKAWSHQDVPTTQPDPTASDPMPAPQRSSGDPVGKWVQ